MLVMLVLLVTLVVLAVLVVWAVMKLPLAGFGLLLLAVILLGAWEWAGLAGLSEPRHRLLYGGLVLTLILALWPWVGDVAFVAGDAHARHRSCNGRARQLGD